MKVGLEGGARRARLAAEFTALFVAAPLAMAVLLPASALFPALFGVTAVGIGLLHITPGFAWPDLVTAMDRRDLAIAAVFGLATAGIGGAVVLATAPAAFLALPRENPALMLMIVALYPFLSALPQEIVFRPLFFRRYGAFMPAGWTGIVFNAALFSAAHLMYWSWIVAAMTFSGGLAFAWAYARRGSFPLAVLLHAVSGIVVFALGLGVFFYSGNVVRPF